MTPVFSAQIRQGKVIFDNREGFDQWVQTLEGRQVEVLVRLPEEIRSNAQGNYYWGVIVKTLSQELGYDNNEMHEVLKYMHNPHNLIVDGEGHRVGGSTRNLSKAEFSDYCERIRRWALSELNTHIPEPNEVET